MNRWIYRFLPQWVREWTEKKRENESNSAKSQHQAGHAYLYLILLIKSLLVFIITNKDADQIVRYEVSSIQGNTNQILSPLVVTPITEGSFQIRTFIKAENIEATYRNVTFKVQEEEIPF